MNLKDLIELVSLFQNIYAKAEFSVMTMSMPIYSMLALKRVLVVLSGSFTYQIESVWRSRMLTGPKRRRLEVHVKG